MPLPNAEPIGLPAPAWLLQFLLVLTFSLHLVPMTLTLGGTVMAVYGEAAARLMGNARYKLLARRLWSMLPAITSFTITLGVAPLLFIQLIYGKFFYPASLLTGWTWFAVVPLLLAGYGLLYLQSWHKTDAAWRPWTGLLAMAAFLAVAAIYVSTMSLTTEPGVWKALYAASQGGIHWFLKLPRYLHVVTGALTMAGGLSLLLANLSTDADFRSFGQRFGSAWLTVSAILAVGAGYWYMSTLTVAPNILLLGAIGFLGALGYIFLVTAGRSQSPRLIAWLGMGGLTLSAVAQGVQRHLVRQSLLAPYITPAADWKLQPQRDVFAIFAVLLVGTIGLLGYLVLRYNREIRAEESKLARSAD